MILITQINRNYSVQGYTLRKWSFPFRWETYIRVAFAPGSMQELPEFWKDLNWIYNPKMETKRRTNNPRMSFVTVSMAFKLWLLHMSLLSIIGMRLLRIKNNMDCFQLISPPTSNRRVGPPVFPQSQIAPKLPFKMQLSIPKIPYYVPIFVISE